MKLLIPSLIALSVVLQGPRRRRWRWRSMRRGRPGRAAGSRCARSRPARRSARRRAGRSRRLVHDREPGRRPLKVTRVIVRTSPRTRASRRASAWSSRAAAPRRPPAGREPEGRGPGGKTAGVRARELYGHVVVESDAVAAGAAGVLRGADRRDGHPRGARGSLGFVGDHILSILTFPAAARRGRGLPRAPLALPGRQAARLMTVVLMGVNLVLAAGLLRAVRSGLHQGRRERRLPVHRARRVDPLAERRVLRRRRRRVGSRWSCSRR